MKKEETTALVKLAKEALNSSEICQGWKDKIYEAAPSLKPQLEVGKWYKDEEYPLHICNIISVGDYDYTFYGLDIFGYWVEDDWYDLEDIHGLKEATHEEVEKALIAEAERRGFKKTGIYRINSASGFDNYKAVIRHDISLDTLNRLWLECGCVFNKGKWATIPEPTVTIGGQECTKEDLENYIKQLNNG